MSDEIIGCGGAIILFLVVLAASSLLSGVVVWWAWGFVMVPVFGAPELSFWQAVVGTWGVHFLLGGSSMASGAMNRKKNDD